jgi:DMSO/TMAO reductase YedYZ molybdopterin-dependent catalytic subunit
MELTPNDEFYTIDINSFPETIDPETWRLEISGLVDDPLSLSLEDLRAYPSTSQVITLSCISNPIGGDLIGTSLWGGVQLKRVLEDAGVQAGAESLFIEGSDGFFESVDLSLTEDDRTLLVYEMNGVPLPVEHGFPLRIYIPDRYGMKQPKWISRIEVINHSGPGYWVERGWSQEALVNTTSVVDDVTVLQSEDGSTAQIGGIAYAGAKGISRVEVQVDEGEWTEAELRSPALSPLTWVQWRLDRPIAEGRHTVYVRSYDSSGRLQETGSRGARPDGATGVHNIDVNI